MTKPEDTPRPVRRHLYGFALLDEIGPLYALYTLWLADHGITTAQVSTVFMLWAIIGIVLEVPSGALADRLDRRRLIAAALVMRALGILVWLVWPTYPGVLLGAMLWAVHTSVASGTWEALVYDQLTRTGEADSYAVVMARVGQWNHAGLAVGTLAATGIVTAGWGIAWTGWVTLALHVPSVWLISTLPRAGAVPDEEEVPLSYRAWSQTLRDGVRAVAGRAMLLRVVVIAGLLEGMFILDEYVQLLGRHRGASDALVPLLVLLVWVGLIAGGEVAARRPKMGGASLALLLGVGVVAMAVGLSSAHLWALGLLGVGYLSMNAVWIVTEARLQELAPDETRATVRSVVALGGNLLSAFVFVLIGTLSRGDDPAPGLLASLILLLLVLPMMWRWLPTGPRDVVG